MAYLEEQARRKALRTVYGVKQRVEPQPMRHVFQTFDQVIKILQVKPLNFLAHRPSFSSFADTSPQYSARPKKGDIKVHIELLQDWVKKLEKRGHPSLSTTLFGSWGIPFATYTSRYSCRNIRSDKDCEMLMLHQVDAGRLLHAFVCRGSAGLDEFQILLLLPHSAPETLLCWLEGRSGVSHRIVAWKDLQTDAFEEKIGKTMRKLISPYPLPRRFAIRDPDLAQSAIISPPPYQIPLSVHSEPSGTPNVPVELGQPDARELDATTLPKESGRATNISPSREKRGWMKRSVNTLRRRPVELSGNSPIKTASPLAETNED